MSQASDGWLDGEPPTRRLQLSEQVAQYLRNAVMSGQLRAGEFIRLEAIALRLGTSVTPVREALLLLRGEDVVKLVPHRGYVVCSLTRVDVEDLFDVQAHLSGELTARAAGAITAGQLEELTDISRREIRAVHDKDGTDIERMEYQFHRIINRSTESRKLGYLMRNTSRYLPRNVYAADEMWRWSSEDDHRLIIDALRAGDAAAARSAAVEHVRAGKEKLLRHLDEIGFWSQTD